MKTVIDKVMSTKEGRALIHKEQTIMNFLEMVCRVMEEDGVKQEDLVKECGMSGRQFTKILNGKDSMTISEMSRIMFALNRNIWFASNRIKGV